MGQKIHPEGFRVGYIHDWKSTWFEEKNFADVLQEDLQIRDHIVNKLSHPGCRVALENEPGDDRRVGPANGNPAKVWSHRAPERVLHG